MIVALELRVYAMYNKHRAILALFIMSTAISVAFSVFDLVRIIQVEEGTFLLSVLFQIRNQHTT